MEPIKAGKMLFAELDTLDMIQFFFGKRATASGKKKLFTLKNSLGVKKIDALEDFKNALIGSRHDNKNIIMFRWF